MFLKNKKNKHVEIANKRSISPADIYLTNVSQYIDYLGEKLGVDNPNNDKDFFNKWAGQYYDAAMYFVNYLEEHYTEEVFQNNEDVTLDVDDMITGMTDEAKLFFGSAKYPNLIYIDESRYSTHFHVDDNKVHEAEFVEVLPGLSRILANEKINRLFCDLTIPEVRALLNQMGILPRNNELDEIIKDVNKRELINRNFLETILALILVKRQNYTLERARLFAEAFGIKFELDPLTIENNGQTLKKV